MHTMKLPYAYALSLLAELQRRVWRSAFVRHSATLAIGTAASQAIPILASPALTRLYLPQDFGAFGLFVSVAAILSIAATGRYESAILIAADAADAVHVVWLTLAFALAFSAALLAVLLALSAVLAGVPGGGGVELFLLLPLMVFANAVYQALNYWFNRVQEYRYLARMRVVRAFAAIAVTLLLGIFPLTGGGLVLGMLAGQVLVSLLLYRAWRRQHDIPPAVAAIWRHAVRYRRFAFFSVPGDTLNSLTGQLPVFVFSTCFGAVTTGHYNLTQRVLASPLGLLSTAIGDVFRERASHELRRDGAFRSLYLKTLAALLAVSVPLYTTIFLLAPVTFAWLFGPQWQEAGDYARILTPFFMLSFAASILGRTTQIAERQSADLVWQVVLVSCVSLSLAIGVGRHDARIALQLFTISYSVMYLLYMYMCFVISGEGTAPRLESGAASGASLARPIPGPPELRPGGKGDERGTASSGARPLIPSLFPRAGRGAPRARDVATGIGTNIRQEPSSPTG